MAGSGETVPTAAFDNFYSPRNDEFYRQSPYKSLDRANHELRLIRLFPGSRGDPLECELVDNLKLDDVRSEYIAISYYAGDPRDTDLISVNGIQFNAFATLANAVRDIRLSADALECMGVRGRNQMLWVDQICINQSDFSERAHQVGFMKDIYEGAGRVIVWLGGESSNGRGLRFLNYHYRQVIELVESVTANNPDDTSDPEALTKYACEMLAQEIANDVRDSTFIENWNGVRELVFSPWWSRCWVAQELIVSRAAALVLGRETIGWDKFRVAFMIVEGIIRAIFQKLAARNALPEGDELRDLRSILGHMNLDHIKFLIQRQKEWADGISDKLTPLLSHSRVCKSSDPRDRIYAFLGLADPSYNIVPVYDRANTIEDTLCHTAKRVILKDHRLDILSLSQETDRAEGLPSWVPDWRVPLSRDFLFDTDYRACGEFPAVASFHASADGARNRVLRTACVVIDQLASLTTMSLPHEDGKVGHTITKWLPIANVHLDLPTERQEKYHYTGQSMTEALLDIVHLGKGWNPESGEITNNVDEFQVQRQKELLKDRNKYLVELVCGGDWVFFRSPKGFIGVADSRSLYTDFIVIALGASVPYILRKEEAGYRLIGCAYVHGIMEGELMEMINREELCIEMISII
ncbi:heterokaryon incompatibility 6 OR allele [Fusarium mundagurra]|uniref:Heterokaryon incompatibility 6 OR allele n=1 Tax=Fusarium mundagurra TaxID=1567541 RepID=A0A8H5XVK6_9HYPO|nr:heterokaryon incompatibility 6 OR allele [Fusarium mundagurra]